MRGSTSEKARLNARRQQQIFPEQVLQMLELPEPCYHAGLWPA